MKKTFDKASIVGIDTNILIYYLQKHPEFGPLVRDLFLSFFNDKKTIITSVITVTEVLSFDLPKSLLERLEDELFLLPSLEIVDVSPSIAKSAAQIRRVYCFGLADSIQLATALSANVDIFITNDQELKRFEDLEVRILSKDEKIF